MVYVEYILFLDYKKKYFYIVLWKKRIICQYNE